MHQQSFNGSNGETYLHKNPINVDSDTTSTSSQTSSEHDSHLLLSNKQNQVHRSSPKFHQSNEQVTSSVINHNDNLTLFR